MFASTGFPDHLSFFPGEPQISVKPILTRLFSLSAAECLVISPSSLGCRLCQELHVDDHPSVVAPAGLGT